MSVFLNILSYVYNLITSIRNKLFDLQLIKTKSYDVPIICIGNLSVGGTGKTPHVDYLCSLLSENFKIAILSRGYKRETKNFNYVDVTSNPTSVGDEPYLLKQKNPQAIVAVEKDRNKGIVKILRDYPETNLIILDDGFQHRKIKAKINVILSPIDNLYIYDKVLPAGKLRENKSGAHRANIIIITNTKKEINKKEKENIIESLELKDRQHCFFSSVRYLNLKPLFGNQEIKINSDYSITLVAGIANVNYILKYLEKEKIKFNLIKFSDHHKYTEKDISTILDAFYEDKNEKKIILTTEKDVIKIKQFDSLIKKNILYYLPIEVKLDNEEKFIKQILSHVKED